jgi:hypothetical protein
MDRPGNACDFSGDNDQGGVRSLLADAIPDETVHVYFRMRLLKARLAEPFCTSVLAQIETVVVIVKR